MHNKLSRVMGLIVLALTALVVSASPLWAKSVLNIVTTTPDLADAVRNVGGSHVSVSNICLGYQDPHQVETKPSYLRKLQGADGFIQTGLSLEIAWAPSLLRSARNTKIMPGNSGFFDASTGITPMEKPTGGVDRTMGDVHPNGNPHYTLSPNNMKIVARNVTVFLKRLDPANAATYDANYSAYWHKLDAADKRWKAQLAPYAGSPLVTYHSTWPYFANHFKLRLVGYIEPKPGISPSTKHLNALTTTITKNHCRVIVVEPWFNDSIARSVAGKTNAKVMRLPALPGGVPGTDSYIDMMNYNVRSLVEALR